MAAGAAGDLTAPVAGSVAEALAAARDALDAAGVKTPRFDSEVLLCEATGRDRAALAADPEGAVDPAAARRFGTMVRRRLRREPVAYVVGRRGFRDVELQVDPRVLIPRPETELLVEVGVECAPRSVLDVGTGSAAVAIALADELPRARIVATDTSAGALEVARANAERLGFAERIDFRLGTLPEAAPFDLLVANLPYVSEAEWGGLGPEITRYEPRDALVAGPTGLEAIRGLLERVGRGDVEADAVALEIGGGQATEVTELARGAGYPRVETRRDLAGIDRVVAGSKR